MHLFRQESPGPWELVQLGRHTISLRQGAASALRSIERVGPWWSCHTRQTPTHERGNPPPRCHWCAAGAAALPYGPTAQVASATRRVMGGACNTREGVGSASQAARRMPRCHAPGGRWAPRGWAGRLCSAPRLPPARSAAQSGLEAGRLEGTAPGRERLARLCPAWHGRRRRARHRRRRSSAGSLV